MGMGRGCPWDQQRGTVTPGGGSGGGGYGGPCKRRQHGAVAVINASVGGAWKPGRPDVRATQGRQHAVQNHGWRFSLCGARRVSPSHPSSPCPEEIPVRICI